VDTSRTKAPDWRRQSVVSRRWGFLVNTVAASPLLSGAARLRLLARCGLSISGAAHVGPSCYFHHADIHIGEHSTINRECYFENVANVTIGTYCGLSIGVMVVTSNHSLGPPHARSVSDWRYESVTIEDGCWIGARATIMPGVTIGRGCVVGAGALVRDDCEPNGLYVGVPAKRIRELER